MILKKSFVCLVLSSFVLAGTSFNADAKRLGGSKSMGKQSQSVTQKQQAAPTQPTAPAAAPAPAAKPAPATPAAQPKKGFGMAGILGGLAAGLGLGWLLSHFGLGEAAASFFMGLLVVLLVVMVGAWLFRRFSGNQATYKTSPAGGPSWEPNDRFDRQEPTSSGSAPVNTPSVATEIDPAIKNFDQESFLVNAKKHFVHLQDAWDQDRKSTRLNSSHIPLSRMPSSA